MARERRLSPMNAKARAAVGAEPGGGARGDAHLCAELANSAAVVAAFSAAAAALFCATGSGGPAFCAAGFASGAARLRVRSDIRPIERVGVGVANREMVGLGRVAEPR